MISAFLLGLMGSLHCAGMCGPLVLMTPVVGHTRASRLASRVVYHAGRIAIYACIGLLFGLIGESLVFAGFQRWLSLIAGLLMAVWLLAGAFLNTRLTRIPLSIKTLFGQFLRKRSYTSSFALGATNGLLPCGLVYMAATASIASGSLAKSVFCMVLFGLGTLPMLLGISFAGGSFKFSRGAVFRKLAPAAAAAVALFLIVRSQPIGLLFGGPTTAQCPACVK